MEVVSRLRAVSSLSARHSCFSLWGLQDWDLGTRFLYALIPRFCTLFHTEHPFCVIQSCFSSMLPAISSARCGQQKWAVRICPCRKKQQVGKNMETRGKGVKMCVDCAAFQAKLCKPLSAVCRIFALVPLEAGKLLLYSLNIQLSLASKHREWNINECEDVKRQRKIKHLIIQLVWCELAVIMMAERFFQVFSLTVISQPRYSVAILLLLFYRKAFLSGTQNWKAWIFSNCWIKWSA